MTRGVYLTRERGFFDPRTRPTGEWCTGWSCRGFFDPREGPRTSQDRAGPTEPVFMARPALKSSLNPKLRLHLDLSPNLNLYEPQSESTSKPKSRLKPSLNLKLTPALNL